MTALDRRKFLKSAAAATAIGVVSGCVNTNQSANTGLLKQQGASVMGLAVPKMDVVRVGFIGVGQRGTGHVKHYCHLEGVEIKAICDTHEAVLDRSIEYVVKQGFAKPDRYTGSDYAYRKMLARPDIDIVIISTPWKWHTPMSVEAMESG